MSEVSTGPDDLLPLHPFAEEALGDAASWTVAELTAALAAAGPAPAPAAPGPAPGRITAQLAAAVAALAVDHTAPVPVPVDRLLTAASREAEIQGDIRIHGEYLLLGILRALGDSAALHDGRVAFHELRRDQAIEAYRRLPLLPRRADAPRPRVLLIAGVPGTGKSTLAEGLARELRVPVFSLDWQLGALVPFGALRDDNAVPLSEVALVASVARQLQLGLSAIVDTAAVSVREREVLRGVAESLDADFVGVECVCSDESLHRERVTGRSRGIPGWHATVPWAHVERMRERWEDWPERDVLVDSAAGDAESALKQVLARIDGATGD
jgi:predicted kinase